MTDTTIDPFWQEQIALHVANRGKEAALSACGTCRSRTDDGRTVEHDECARRATLIEAPDMPDWELLVSMSEREKADLPARFHIPRFDDCGKPNAWLCAVCWGDGWVTQWPCATAQKHGTHVFTPQHETQQEQDVKRARFAAKLARQRAAKLRNERDAWHDWADSLAYKVAPVEVLGRHGEEGRFPWSDALDLITPAAEVEKLRARVAELEAAVTQIRHLHKDSPMGPCPVCVDGDALARGDDYTVPYPCPTARAAGATDCEPKGATA
jgi:hypothetical protein